jgi:hypothetical protein
MGSIKAATDVRRERAQVYLKAARLAVERSGGEPTCRQNRPKRRPPSRRVEHPCLAEQGGVSGVRKALTMRASSGSGSFIPIGLPTSGRSWGASWLSGSSGTALGGLSSLRRS